MELQTTQEYFEWLDSIVSRPDFDGLAHEAQEIGHSLGVTWDDYKDWKKENEEELEI